MSDMSAGTLLREWRQHRNLSQLELASRAEISARHVSRVECGLVRPSPDMVLRLCDQLRVPLREQNRLLLAGGYAPAHPEHALADPPMAEANAALETILRAHEPYPALVIDRAWELVAANDAAFGLLDGIPPDLLEPPVNVIRLSLHPRGLAPRIVNLDEWRDHLVDRLRRDHDLSAEPALRELIDEIVRDGPDGPDGPDGTHPARSARTPGLIVPLRLRAGDGELAFVSTTTVFGTPREVTLSELAIEAFYPADDATRRALAAAVHG